MGQFRDIKNKANTELLLIQHSIRAYTKTKYVHIFYFNQYLFFNCFELNFDAESEEGGFCSDSKYKHQHAFSKDYMVSPQLTCYAVTNWLLNAYFH